MANYNANKQENGGCFNQYVNFDQFLMQHNIGNASPFYSPQQPFGYPVYNNYQNSPQTGFNASASQQQQQQNGYHHQSNSPMANGNFYPSVDQIQNSNLVATASEFVPQKATTSESMPPKATNSTLLASADEFIPKNKTNIDAEAATRSTGNKNRSPRNDGADSVTDRLSRTHISDDAENTSLNSSGGAIKKIRNTRTDSGDRQSSGLFCF